MSILISGVVAKGAEKPGSADNSLVVTFQSTTSVGNTAFLGLSYDNTAAATPTVSSVVDSRGNSWSQVADSNASTATAAAGVRCTVWRCDITIAHQVGDTLTVTLSANVVAKAGCVLALSGAAGAIAGLVTSRGTAAMTAQSITPGVAGDCVIGFAAFEDNTVETGDTDTTNGLWSAIDGTASSGAGAATNASINVQAKVVTATGAQSWQPVGTSDWSSIAFYISAGIFPGTVSGTGTVQTTHVVLLASLPAQVAGTGTVQSPTIVGRPVPSHVGGTGAVQTPVPDVRTGAAITDTFTRANSASSLGVADTGQTWSPLVGTWGITSNKAYLVSPAAQAVAALDAGVPDGTFQCDVTLSATTDRADAGIFIRGTDANNYLLITVTKVSGTNGVRVFSEVEASFTLLTTVLAGALVNGNTYTVKVVMAGNNIDLYVDGVLLWQRSTAISGVPNTATKIGIREDNTGGSTDDGGSRFDNLSFIPLVVGTVTGTGTVQGPTVSEVAFPTTVGGSGTVQQFGGVYLRVPGGAGDNATTPDAAPLRITGDIGVFAWLALDDWNTGVQQVIAARWSNALANKSWELQISTAGRLALNFYDGTTTYIKTSTVSPTVTNGQFKGLGATCDLDDGAGNHVTTFWQSDDFVTWTRFGAIITSAGAITAGIQAGASPLWISSHSSMGVNDHPLTGKVRRVRLASGLATDGTGAVFDADFSAQVPGTLTFNEGSSNAATVTVQNNASIDGGSGQVNVLSPPSSVSGSGSVQAPVGVEVAKPSHVAGVGTVQTATAVASSARIVRFSLSTLVTPPDTTYDTLSIRARQANPTDDGILRVWLYESSTLIETWDITLTDAWFTTDHLLANAASIVDFDALEVQMQAIATGTSVTPQVSAIYATTSVSGSTSVIVTPTTVTGVGAVQGTAGITYSAAILARSPVLYLRLNGPTDTTDASGNGHVININTDYFGDAPGLTPGDSDHAIKGLITADGTLSVAAASDLELTDHLSIVFTILPRYHTEYALHFQHGTYPATANWLVYFLGDYTANGGSDQSGQMGIWATRAGVGWDNITGITTLTLNVAQHVVITYDKDVGGRIFVNGVEVANHLAALGPLEPATGEAIYLGAPVDQVVDEFALFGSTLTSAQVTDLYRAWSRTLAPIETARPSTVSGVGSVQSAVGVDAPTSSTITGAGSIQAPTEVVVAKPATVAGVGTVQAPAATSTPIPAVITGAGSVQTATIVEVAKPTLVAGTGTVQTPVDVDLPTPALVTGTGTVQAPVGLVWALPTLVTGIGTVQAPVGVAVVKPALVTGTGTVQAAAAVDLPVPATIIGVGSIGTVVLIETAKPFTVSGAGTVGAVVVVIVATPSVVTGTGTVQAPTGIVVAFPAVFVGIGTVQTVVEVDAAQPTVVSGIGTVQTITGLVRAFPVLVLGVGAVQTTAPTDLPSAGSIIGVGSVGTPLVIVVALPATFSGIGLVQAPAATDLPTPTVVLGQGVVQSMVGIVVAKPGLVVGLGVVQAPTSIESPLSTTVAGTGTVQVVVVAIAALPLVIVGVGTVQSLTGVEQALVAAAVLGQGTVQSTLIVLQAVAATVLGSGTVQSVAATPSAGVSTTTGTGTVQSVLIAIAATPATVLGLGSVETTIGVATVFVSSVLGTGSVQAAFSVPTGTPDVVLGAGLVQSPTFLVVAFPASVIGVGQVISPSVSTDSSATAIVATVTATGVVQSVVVIEVVLPSTFLGLGSVGSVLTAASPALATIVGFGVVPDVLVAVAATPMTLIGTGIVQPVTVLEVALAFVVLGTGSVGSPDATSSPVSATIVGFGSVPAVFITLASAPTTLVGVGLVQTTAGLVVVGVLTFTGIGSVGSVTGFEAPATEAVLGVGTLQAVLVALVALPSSVEGVGVVGTPSAGAESSIQVATVYGLGSVPTAIIKIEAVPNSVAGIGMVFDTTTLPTFAVTTILGSGTFAPVLIIVVVPAASVPGVGLVQDHTLDERVSPGSVVGTGSVAAFTGVADVSPAPVIGVGTLGDIVLDILRVVAPTTVEGLGTVIVVTIPITASGSVLGVGTVGTLDVMVIVLVSSVIGAGSVMDALAVAQATTIIGIGTVQATVVGLVFVNVALFISIAKRLLTPATHDRLMTSAITDRSGAASATDRGEAVVAAERPFASVAKEGAAVPE